MVASSSKVSSKVSYSTSTTNTAEAELDEQYSTLLHDLFSFRKQDPNLFQTLMDSLHHHQGEQRRCDLDTLDNNDDDDDDVITRQRNINDKREDIDSITNVTNSTRLMKTNSSKKMQAKSMMSTSYYSAPIRIGNS